MKLNNSTSYPDYFLRRMVSWCCKELGLPVRWVNKATFKNARRSVSGLAGGRSFIVRIGHERWFPSREWRRGGITVPSFPSRTDALVEVTLHELQHLNQSYTRHTTPGWKKIDLHDNAETDAQFAALHGYRKFVAERDALLATWSYPVPEKKSAPVSIVDQRAAKVEADLARWTRKLKLAQTKIRKLKMRQRYYTKKQAAIPPKGTS